MSPSNNLSVKRDDLSLCKQTRSGYSLSIDAYRCRLLCPYHNSIIMYLLYVIDP